MHIKTIAVLLGTVSFTTGCATLPTDYADQGYGPGEALPADVDRPDPVDVARPVVRTGLPRETRDTPAVINPRLTVGYKPQSPDSGGFPRFEPELAYAQFDDALAIAEAIEGSPPDFAFRLSGREAWAWSDPSGELVIAEGEGSQFVQYFFAARDDRPVFVRTSSYAHAYADGRLIGTFQANGARVAERIFNNSADAAEQLHIRGRALYHAADDRRWDNDTARRWSTVQPSYGSWIGGWILPSIWAPEYRVYRGRPDAAQRRDRRRLTRDQRRDRAARYERWRNGGAIGAPPGGGTGDSAAPPRGPGRPDRPGQPPRNGNSDGRPPAVPATPPPTSPTAPTPFEPTPMPEDGQRRIRVQPERPEIERRDGERPDGEVSANPTMDANGQVRRQQEDDAREQATRRLLEERRQAREVQAQQERAAAAEAAAAERAARAAEQAAAADRAAESEAAAQRQAAQERAAQRAADQRAAAERAAAERVAAQQADAQRAAAARAAQEAAQAAEAARAAAEAARAARAAEGQRQQQTRTAGEGATDERPE